MSMDDSFMRKWKREPADDSSFETEENESFGNCTFTVLPLSYHTAANVSYDGMEIFPQRGDSLFLEDNIDRFESHLQKFEFYSGNPITPNSKSLFKADSDSPTNHLKKQLSEIANSSPSRVLQNYLDGSIGLIPIFPMSSSAPSSRDQTKDLIRVIDTNIVTTQFESPISSKKKATTSKPIQKKPAKGLTTKCDFQLSSSIDESTLDSSNNSQCMEGPEELPLHVKQNSLSIGESPTVPGTSSNEGEKSLDNYIKSIKIKKEIPITFKLKNSKQPVVKPKHSGKRGKVTHRKRAPKLRVPSTDKISKLSEMLPYSTNRPKRNIVRPKNYYDVYEAKEESDNSSPSKSSSGRSSESYSKDSKPPHSFKRLGNTTATVRSKNGCWTCRLRRKKCPEEKPECAECTRLGLQCDNSEVERPAYMNDKKAAKRKMDEIKEITNLKKKIRMSNRLLRFKKSKKST